MSSVEKRCIEKDQHLREVNEELRMIKISSSTKEGDGYYASFFF